MTKPRRDGHCTFCGAAFPEATTGWPRQCASCECVSYRNPLPVAVVLQPVDAGLLLIRRGVEPRKGHLAFPGGYVDFNEPWQQAAARELREETGVVIDPATVTLFDVLSANDNTLMIFAVAPPLSAEAVARFEPSEEATEQVVVAELTELAFPLHEAVMRAYFARRS